MLSHGYVDWFGLKFSAGKVETYSALKRELSGLHAKKIRIKRLDDFYHTGMLSGLVRSWRVMECRAYLYVDNPMGERHGHMLGVCALVTLSRMNEFALQSSARAPLAPRISSILKNVFVEGVETVKMLICKCEHLRESQRG